METEKLRRRSCRLNMEIARRCRRCPPEKNQKQADPSRSENPSARLKLITNK